MKDEEAVNTRTVPLSLRQKAFRSPDLEIASWTNLVSAGLMDSHCVCLHCVCDSYRISFGHKETDEMSGKKSGLESAIMGLNPNAHPILFTFC